MVDRSGAHASHMRRPDDLRPRQRSGRGELGEDERKGNAGINARYCGVQAAQPAVVAVAGPRER